MSSRIRDSLLLIALVIPAALINSNACREIIKPPAARGDLFAQGDRCRLQVQVKKWKTSPGTKPPLRGWVRRTPAPLDPPQKLLIEKKLFLWKIDRGKKKQASFILGSVHFLKKEFHPLDQAIENAFVQTTVLAVETYMKPAERVAVTMKKGIYQADDPHTLENQISAKTYRLVQEKLKTSGLDIGLFKKFKPWYLAQTISYMRTAARGFQPGHGLDVYFLEKAEKDPVKKIIALEKLEEQIDFYDGLPAEVNEAYLLSSLEKNPAGNGNQGIEAVAAAWAAGDTREMERLLTLEINKKPGLEILYEKLIYERNRNMAARISSHLKTGDKSYFFLVGAFHLVGKRGIIQLLKDNGFRLQQSRPGGSFRENRPLDPRKSFSLISCIGVK